MRRCVAIFTPSNRRGPQQYRSAGYELFLQRDGCVEILRLNTLVELLRGGFELESSIAERMRGVEVTTDLFPAGHHLISWLRARGHETFAAREVTRRALKQLERFDPDLICISTTFLDSLEELAELSARLREAAPRALQVAGGMLVWKQHLIQQRKARDPEMARHAGVTLFDDRDFLDACEIDAFVVTPFSLAPLEPLLAQAGRRRRSLRSIDNLFVRARRGRSGLTRLTDLPYDPEQDVIDWHSVDTLPRSIPLRTSVGCPHRCLYCDYCETTPKVHLKPRRVLRRELGALEARAAHSSRHHLFCVDDNTFLSRARVRQVCGALIDAGLELPWRTMSEVETIDDENVELIRQTNLVEVSVGLESGDDTILANMNKRIDKRRLRRGARLLDRNGTSVSFTLIAGFPGETLETIENTAAFLDGLGLDQALSSYQIYPLSVMPLAALSSEASRRRFMLEGSYSHWRHATCSSRSVHDLIPIYLQKIKSLYLNHADDPRRIERELDQPTRRALVLLRRELALRTMQGSSDAAIRDTLRKMCEVLSVNGELPDDLRNTFVMRRRGR